MRRLCGRLLGLRGEVGFRDERRAEKNIGIVSQPFYFLQWLFQVSGRVFVDIFLKLVYIKYDAKIRKVKG